VFPHRIQPWSSGTSNVALFIDPENNLWIGPTTGGREPFYCYDVVSNPDGASQLKLLKVLRVEQVSREGAGLTFAMDRFHHGWVASASVKIAVLDLSNNKVIHELTPASGLLTDQPRALMTDRLGTMWCGTWAVGLVFITPRADTFTIQKGPAVIEGAGVRSLYEDHQGSVWIGTRYAGLVRSRNGEYKTVSVRNGLLSNAIWSIAETDHRIWCGTDVGLEVVDKETCRPLLPKSELIGSRVYASGAYKNAYVWCVLEHELVIFQNPEQVTHTPPPPVYVKSYVVNGVPMSPDSLHEFDYTQNSCSFDFVGISFRDERNVRYQYRMIGHDSSWTKPVKEHTVTYASLKPGTYAFQVRAINGEGVASISPASVSFIIVPPFWMRWWFIIGMALLVLSVFFGLFRYRLYHIMNMERMRLRIASDLHDDVGTNLSSIVVSSQIMERDRALSSELRTQLQEIRSTAATTQEMMRDIVWMLNPSNDSLDDFVLKMKDAASRLLGDIPFTFVVPSERMLEKVSIEFKRNVFLIFKEALNNVARHSSATMATIEVTHGNGLFTLRIQDNGKGIDPSLAQSGSGIASLKRRAEQIGGTIEFAGSSAGGTVVTLSVKNHANA
jgi:Y_Y_Y domain/Histidine kinase/Histidine kinase-, DNA gyrase B-, and HSP90-like ATPase/Two component regulator propeller